MYYIYIYTYIYIYIHIYICIYIYKHLPAKYCQANKERLYHYLVKVKK